MHHIIIDFSQRRSVPMRPPPVRARVRRRRRRATTRRRDERNSSPPTPIRARRRLHPRVHRAQQSLARLLVALSRHDVRSRVRSRPRPRACPSWVFTHPRPVTPRSRRLASVAVDSRASRRRRKRSDASRVRLESTRETSSEAHSRRIATRRRQWSRRGARGCFCLVKRSHGA